MIDDVRCDRKRPIENLQPQEAHEKVAKVSARKVPKSSKKIKIPAPNQCNFQLPGKRRQCSMLAKKGHLFCSEHQVQDPNSLIKRVPCPLDPKHTIQENELEAHMKKCPARPKETDPWYEMGINIALQGDQEHGKMEKGEKGENDENGESGENGEIGENSAKQEIDPLFFTILDNYIQKMDPIEFHPRDHPGLKNRLDEKLNQKHVLQQSSLIGALKEFGLLSTENFYVEFGCGKAELSRTVNLCILHDREEKSQKQINELEKELQINQKEDEIENQKEIIENVKETETFENYGYGLIDRGVNRMKMDNKIIQDSGNLKPVIKRSRIDIEHLNLDKFRNGLYPGSMVGISKHLCGVATDLTLKCILNLTQSLANFNGMVVAMCCRHVCDYSRLLEPSREYLAIHGIKDSKQFEILKRIVTWAVCAKPETERGEPEPEKGEEREPKPEKREEREPENKETSEILHTLKSKGSSSIGQSEKYGLIARRLIDESRVYALKKILPNYQIGIFQYISKEITPENSALYITKK